MKILLAMITSCYLVTVYANQVEILIKSRDHYLEQAIGQIQGYCKSETYYCRLQLEADCKLKTKKSCEILAIVKDLEKKVLSTDEVISQIQPVPLYKNLKSPTETEVRAEEEKENIQPSIPNFKTVSVKYGSAKPKTPEGIKAYEELLELHKKITSQKIRTDCSTDAECKFQEYGAKICGGPTGSFAYSTNGGESDKVIKDIILFNQKDKEIVQNYNKEYLGTCDWRGRSEPAKCMDNYCI